MGASRMTSLIVRWSTFSRSIHPAHLLFRGDPPTSLIDVQNDRSVTTLDPGGSDVKGSSASCENGSVS